MTEELNAIAAIPGITAVCCHRGAETVFQNFSRAYGQATANALSKAATDLFATYTRGNRPLTQAWFQYPECGLLLLAAPGGQQMFLSLMVQDTAAIGEVLAPARAFLARHAAAA